MCKISFSILRSYLGGINLEIIIYTNFQVHSSFVLKLIWIVYCCLHTISILMTFSMIATIENKVNLHGTSVYFVLARRSEHGPQNTINLGLW